MAELKPVTDATIAYGDERAAEAQAPLNAQIAALELQVAALQAQIDNGTDPTPDPGPVVGRYPCIFGAATSNDQTKFEALNKAWGPIRMTREYDLGKGVLPVDQYAWFNFSKQFDYITFSTDEQKSVASYQAIADGKHDTAFDRMVASVKSKLTGKQGVILLGNEPNTEIAPTNGGSWRAAMEHLIDRYGYRPAPGFLWGVAFSNYNVWGPGSKSAGKGWLPRRNDGPFMVETHFYGRDGYGDPGNHLGNLIAEMKNHPKWIWGIGEISAQEDPTQTKKGAWFTEVWNYSKKNGISTFLPFDTNVGGSADVNTSENSRKAVKAIAVECANNNWT